MAVLEATADQRAALLQIAQTIHQHMLDQLPPDLRFAVIGILVVDAHTQGTKVGEELSTFDAFMKHHREEVERMAKERAREKRM
jgi:hypothetical protein